MSKEKPWMWGIHPLEDREVSILTGLLCRQIEESERSNNWRQTPHSEDLKKILEKLEDIG